MNVPTTTQGKGPRVDTAPPGGSKVNTASHHVAPFSPRGSLREQMRHLICYAVQAPSMHNSQPWRFRLTDSSVELVADRYRLPRVDDPTGRGLSLAAGAAIHHLELAMRCYRLATQTTYLRLSPEDVVAEVRVVGNTLPSRQELSLLEELLRRHRIVSPPRAPTIPGELLFTLRDGMRPLRASLAFLREGCMARLVSRLVEETDELVTTYLPKGPPCGADSLFMDDREAATSPLTIALLTPTDSVADRVAAGTRWDDFRSLRRG